jgi:isopenicillin N synthase-like dioxygenase
VLTFLVQQGQPGFEVCLADGQWVPVSVPASAAAAAGAGSWILVQGGDCLRRWTNHRYQSALHRVVPHTGRGDRYAMPLFWGPGEGHLMSTLPGCVDAANGNPDRYAPITYADYMTGFAKAEEEGELSEYSTVRSLTPAQKRAAAENRVD